MADSPDFIWVSSGSVQHGNAASGIGLARMLSPAFWPYGESDFQISGGDDVTALGRMEIANLIAAVKRQYAELDGLKSFLRRRQVRKNAPKWLKGLDLG